MNYVYTAAIAFTAGVIVGRIYYSRLIVELKADTARLRTLLWKEAGEAKERAREVLAKKQ